MREEDTPNCVGVTFSHNLDWKSHNNRRLNLAEAAWACISRLGTSRGGLSPTAWRQVYTGSIRAIATYGWELGHTDAAEERLRKLQYKALRKVTGAYHGARQETLEAIAKIEPVAVKLWDMKVRASARILEKGIQDNLIEETEIYRGNGRSWKDHSLAWAHVPRHRQYNTCLEEILATMGENGEREIPWDFDRGTKQIRNLEHRDQELGTKDTPRIVWEMRIRDLEEDQGWTTAFTDGSGLDNKAAGGFCSNPNKPPRTLDPMPDLWGNKYLGTRATHIDGELEGIALALEAHEQTGMLAILSDCRPAIRTTENIDSGAQGPRSHIEARIQEALVTRGNRQLETMISWVKGHKDIKGNERADILSK